MLIVVTLMSCNLYHEAVKVCETFQPALYINYSIYFVFEMCLASQACTLAICPKSLSYSRIYPLKQILNIIILRHYHHLLTIVFMTI